MHTPSRRKLLEDPAQVRARADRRRADTVRDGDIETNPGPSSSSQAFRVFTCNANGYANSYHALDIAAAERPHFICLQEVNASSTSGDQLLNRCRLLGYRAWVALGPPTGNVSYGGVLLAARRDVRAHFVQKDVNDSFEAISIDAENFFLTTVWQRPHKVSDSSFEA